VQHYVSLDLKNHNCKDCKKNDKNFVNKFKNLSVSYMEEKTDSSSSSSSSSSSMEEKNKVKKPISLPF
jgi:hypothetical protein